VASSNNGAIRRTRCIDERSAIQDDEWRHPTQSSIDLKHLHRRHGRHSDAARTSYHAHFVVNLAACGAPYARRALGRKLAREGEHGG